MDEALINDAAWLLLEQALLIEGLPVENPGTFVQRLNRVLEPRCLDQAQAEGPAPQIRGKCGGGVFACAFSWVTTAAIFSRSSDTVYGFLITPASAPAN